MIPNTVSHAAPTATARLDEPIPRKWLAPVWAAWLVIALLLVGLYVAGVLALFEQLRTPCIDSDCHTLAISPLEANLLQELGVTLEFYAGFLTGADILGFVILTPLAILIFWRKSDRWMGILVSMTLLFFGVFFGPGSIALLIQNPELGRWLTMLDFVSGVLLVLLFYIFPDGRFVPRWTRFLAIALAGIGIIEQFLTNNGPVGSVQSLPVLALFLGTLIVGVMAQVYRYRRVSTATQRQQTKWIMFGLFLTFSIILLWSVFAYFLPLRPGAGRLVFNLGNGLLAIVFLILPFSVAASILRYRLWDIDIAIKLTLVYGLLTAVLALVYFASVILLEQFLRGLIGPDSSLAIVVSTLMIAAMFTPLRRRVQNLIDQRFYRRKYDAKKTMDRFAASARDEVDLDQLTAELLRVVARTMQPEHLSIWLKDQQDPKLANGP